MTEKTLTTSDLHQFCGSETWYSHPFNRKITFTDGVKYVADHGGAYWLIDDIVIFQEIPAVKVEQFQVWTLKVRDRSGVLTCEDGNLNPVFKQEIDFTDFPLPEITFWFTNNVLFLPSEY